MRCECKVVGLRTVSDRLLYVTLQPLDREYLLPTTIDIRVEVTDRTVALYAIGRRVVVSLEPLVNV